VVTGERDAATVAQDMVAQLDTQGLPTLTALLDRTTSSPGSVPATSA
jgi:hypothetical protein